MRNILRAMALVLATFCAAAPTFSQDLRFGDLPNRSSGYNDFYPLTPGMYFGVNLGVSRYELEQGVFDTDTATTLEAAGFPVDRGTSMVDRGSNAFMLVAGYRIRENLAAELSYADFGTTNYQANTSVSVGFDLGTAMRFINVKARGISASVLGTHPIGQAFDVHGRLGLMLAQTNVNSFFMLPDGTAQSTSDSSRAIDILYSVGGSNRITERWTVSADYLVLKSRRTFLGDVRSIMLGVGFRL